MWIANENADGSMSFTIDGEQVDNSLKFDAPELYRAQAPVIQYIRKNHKYKQCFLCSTKQIRESHVIKREILETMSFDSERNHHKLYTLTPESLGSISVFMEDKSRLSHGEAFTFKLICSGCEAKFPYEDKSKSKEKYSPDELRSIALKVRLKELYDLKEKQVVQNYKPKDIWETIVCLESQRSDFSILIRDEEIEVKKIYNKTKDFEAVVDTIVPFRIPFASEFFLAPYSYPFSNGVIKRNLISSSGTNDDMSAFYVLMEPSANLNDKWSRITMFIEKDDEEMRKWTSEFLKKCGKTKTSLINELISYHISTSAKNFVMQYDINKRFLEKVHSFRGAPQSDSHKISFNWVKAFKAKS